MPSGLKNKIILSISILSLILLAFILSSCKSDEYDFFDKSNHKLLYNMTNNHEAVYRNDYINHRHLRKNGGIFNVYKKNDSKISKEANFTILTPNIDNDLASFSNLSNIRYYERKYNVIDDSEKSKIYNFAYAEESLLTRLYKKFNNADIYYVRYAPENYGDVELLKIDENISDPKNKVSERVNLYKNVYDEILNVNKHNILLFEYSNSKLSNNRVYKEFNYVISKAISRYVREKNELPKINLIGHGRGGITNLQYAMDHSDMIGSLFSISTPYDYSKLLNDVIYKIGKNKDLRGFDVSDVYKDLADPSLFKIYKKRANLTLKKHNLNAITTSFDSNLFNLLDYSKYIKSLIKDMINSDYASEFLDSSYLENAISLLKYDGKSKGANLEKIDKYLDDYYNIVSSSLKTILKSASLNKNDKYIDIFSNGLYESKTQVIPNIMSEYKLSYNSNNLYLNNKFKSKFEFLKNYETHDKRVVSYIMNKLNGENPNNDSKFNICQLPGLLDDEAFLEKYNFIGEEELDIPDTIDGKKIVGILDNCFNGSSDIKTIKLPSNIKEIGEYAFSNMERLENVNIGDTNIKNLSDGTFYNTKSLKEINLPSILEKIGNSAFSRSSIEKINIGDSLKEIDDLAFYKSKIKQIKLPSTLERIGKFAFSECFNLIELDLSQTKVYKLEQGFFESKTKNQRLIFPTSGIKKIESYAFNNMEFDDISIKGDNLVIEEFGFYMVCANKLEFSGTVIKMHKTLLDCAIREVDISKLNINEIFDYAFYGVRYYKIGDVEGPLKITIPENITKIGKYSFAMANWRDFDFQDTITELEDGAFYMAKIDKLVINNLEKISGKALLDLECFDISGDNVVKGVIYSKDRTILFCYPGKINIKDGDETYVQREYTILDVTVELADYAFCNNKSLEKIYLNKVRTIGYKSLDNIKAKVVR